MDRHHVLSGADRISRVEEQLEGKRIGLMTNQTGVNHELRSTLDLLHESCNLTALFAVEHGIRGDAQAGADIGETVDEGTGIRVYSTYGGNRGFSREMLDAFDVLVFDIQDVGARFYTYLYSLSSAMQVCSLAGKQMLVLDRINPLGGVHTGGTVLDMEFASFVGDFELPTQYALTIGEYAGYVREYLHLDLDLTVVPLEGWERWMRLDDTDLPWVSTSPNCPNLETALCYIGMCILEGTNISEGRGTTIPFQIAGAPFIHSGELEHAMAEVETPGIRFRRASFVPTFSKYAGETCHGVQMHIMDREKADVFAAGLLLLDRIRILYPNAFQWMRPGRDGKYMFDKLLGTDAYRTGKMQADELIRSSRPKVRAFEEKTFRFHLY